MDKRCRTLCCAFSLAPSLTYWWRPFLPRRRVHNRRCSMRIAGYATTIQRHSLRLAHRATRCPAPREIRTANSIGGWHQDNATPLILSTVKPPGVGARPLDHRPSVLRGRNDRCWVSDHRQRLRSDHTTAAASCYIFVWQQRAYRLLNNSSRRKVHHVAARGKTSAILWNYFALK